MGGLIVAGVVIAAAVIYMLVVSRPSAVQAQEERDRRTAEQQAQIRCPHCGAQGTVTTQLVRRKQGISGGKATGALLTGGVSMLATGLSRKQTMTHMTCSSCGVEWDVV